MLLVLVEDEDAAAVEAVGVVVVGADPVATVSLVVQAPQASAQTTKSVEPPRTRTLRPSQVAENRDKTTRSYPYVRHPSRPQYSAVLC